MGNGRAILKQISERKNPEAYRHEHWEGSFTDYLDIVRDNPLVTRNAFQRLYEMVISYGSFPIEGTKDNLVRYSFFDDPANDGEDAIFGLTKPLMELVNVFKSAALGYGSERRVLLLHGPVGSSKSTIARLLKRGLERYSQTDEGALYSYGWKNADGTVTWCPMREEPLHLVPPDDRPSVVEFLNEGARTTSRNASIGDLGRPLPPLPVHVQRKAQGRRRKLDQGNGGHRRPPRVSLGTGPRRHRHLPA